MTNKPKIHLVDRIRSKVEGIHLGKDSKALKDFLNSSVVVNLVQHLSEIYLTSLKRCLVEKVAEGNKFRLRDKM